MLMDEPFGAIDPITFRHLIADHIAGTDLLNSGEHVRVPSHAITDTRRRPQQQGTA